jgi:5-methyltetrahydrofolate--homocysteine methyltransferase
MTRRGMTLPLLIGGATTSKKHTALKIAPEYAPGVVHVDDASKAVGVVSRLLSKSNAAPYLAQVREEQEALAAASSRGAERPVLPIAEARANGFDGGWRDYAPARTGRDRGQGVRRLPIAELRA